MVGKALIKIIFWPFKCSHVFVLNLVDTIIPKLTAKYNPSLLKICIGKFSLDQNRICTGKVTQNCTLTYFCKPMSKVVSKLISDANIDLLFDSPVLLDFVTRKIENDGLSCGIEFFRCFETKLIILSRKQLHITQVIEIVETGLCSRYNEFSSLCRGDTLVKII